MQTPPLLRRARLSRAAGAFLLLLACNHILGISAEVSSGGGGGGSSDSCGEGGQCAPREKIGLALNGGVLVAAAGGAAIMRGFQQQTITIDGEERPAMERFDYVSGLSGGNIPTMLYAFAQNVNTNQLLDADYRIDDPSQITRKALNRKPRKSIFRVLTKSLAKRLIPIFLYYSSTKQSLKGVWPLVLWFSFLRPFGIKRNRPFGTSSEKHVISPRDEVRAEPLIATAMVGEVEDWGLEFTEKFLATIGELIKMNLTGTFTNPSQISEALETVNNVTFLPVVTSSSEVAFDFSVVMKSDLSGEFLPSTESMKPSEWGETENKNKRHFSLELALGMGTNFASYVAIENGPASCAKANKFSQQRTTKFGNGVEKNMLFADAGLIYGTNVPSMIKNKVRKIILPVWATDSVSKYSEFYNATKGRPLSEWALYGGNIGLASSLPWFFGLYGGFHNYGFINHIFDEGEVHLKKLRKNFDALYLADKPLVTTLKDVKVIDNPYYGIVGGDKVDITVLYVTMPKSFAQSVPRESVPPPKGTSETVDESGSFTNVELKDFPNLSQFDAVPNVSPFEAARTINFFWNAGLVTNRQANMMSYLGSWLVKEAWEEVSFDGQEYFGGFKEILEA